MYRVLRPGGRAVCAVWGERRNCGWAEIFPDCGCARAVGGLSDVLPHRHRRLPRARRSRQRASAISRRGACETSFDTPMRTTHARRRLSAGRWRSRYSRFTDADKGRSLRGISRFDRALPPRRRLCDPGRVRYRHAEESERRDRSCQICVHASRWNAPSGCSWRSRRQPGSRMRRRRPCGVTACLCEITGPAGEKAVTDMPEPMGGSGHRSAIRAGCCARAWLHAPRRPSPCGRPCRASRCGRWR